MLVIWASSCLIVSGVVATPTFAPTEGDAIGRFNVVVSCATSGATIHYTLTGAEPTVYDRSIASQGSILIDRNMTLKAKAFNAGESSTTASGFFRVTGDIFAGGTSLMALKNDGKLFGWGHQDHGRLSNGSTSTTATATPGAAKSSLSGNPAIVDALQVSVGHRHMVMVDSFGKVWASGNNTLAECGRATGGEFTYAVQVRINTSNAPLIDCESVAAGVDFSAAVQTNGQVRSWGSQVSGRLGNGVHHASNVQSVANLVLKPGSVALTGIQQVALGKDFGIARQDHSDETPGGTGKVWVWGESSTGSLALGSVSDQLFAAEAKASATTGDFLTDALEVDAGETHAVVLRSKANTLDMDGTVWTMGSRANGRIGDNGLMTGNQNYPVKVRETNGTVLNDIIQISAGAAHTLALDKNGKVWAWGRNTQGELGDNSTTDRAGAVQVKKVGNVDLTNIVRISAGGYLGSVTPTLGFSSALAEDGTVYVWGNNKTGVLGNGVVADANTTVATALTSFKTQPGFPTITLDATVGTANAPGTATLTATVADPDGIQDVKFYLNGVLQTTTAQWSATVGSLAEGNYHCYAVVTDATGLETVSLPDTFSILPTLDSDSDGLVDSWEMAHFGNLSQSGSGDPDGDSVSNAAEAAAGTDPSANPDANSDGIPDHWVTWQLSLPGGVAVLDLPASGDPDGDLLTNLREFQLGTRPRHLDSDGDGESDWQELAQQTDPNNASSKSSPLEVSAYEGTTNLVVPQTLTNPITGAAYDLSLLGASPAVEPYEIRSSNQPGGPAYEWIEISGTGERMTAFDSNSYAMVTKTLPFAFPFYGTNYNNIYISGCGFLTLTDPGGSNPGFPVNFRTEFPNPAGHKPLIAPYEQFLEPHLDGSVYYQAFSDKVVVQYEQVRQYGDSLVTLQVVLYPDKTIRCNYKNIPLATGGFYVNGYLVGIQNAAGDKGLAASWYPNTSQQGLLLHSLDPLTIRFAAPTTMPADWVEASTTAVSGDPLGWSLEFTLTGLSPGLQEAQLVLKSQAGTTLYTRAVKLTVLPPGGSGDDTMTGSAANDTISGNGGADTISGLGGNDTLNGGAGSDTLSGGADNDTLNGGNDNDMLTGDAASDILNGDAGNDTLTGGAGDDTLAGGAGKDVYHYDLGDGHDTYTDIDGIHQADDLTADYSDLYFGPGINPAMLRSYYLPEDVTHPRGRLKLEVIHFSGGSVTISDWNVRSGSTNVYVSKRWRFHFADTTVWSGTLFWNLNLSTPFQGFTGGVGNDILMGSAATEEFRGLGGNDLMQGGDGWDTYYYEWGGGDDIIQDTPVTMQTSSLYIHGAALHDKLSYHFVAPDHLRIDIAHPSDPAKNGSVLLREWYRSTPFRVKENWRVYAQDGSGGWTNLSTFMHRMGTDGPDNMLLVYNHTGHGSTFDAGAGNDILHGTSWNESLLGAEGDDVIYAQSGNDTVSGGTGSDTLSGGGGDDALDGGEGDDTLWGEVGVDHLDGGDGADILDGGSDADVLNGGTGDDLLRGSYGSDVYEWDLGDGNDIVTDEPGDSSAGLINRLVFGIGIQPSDVELQVVDTSLKLVVKNVLGVPVGSVTIANWYGGASGGGHHSASWRIEYADHAGDWWAGKDRPTTGPDFLSGSSGSDEIAGGLGNDILQGQGGDDILNGNDGDDSLNGGDGVDALSGGSGADSLEGGDGADSLTAGMGSDYVRGGKGSDHYYWAVGDGNDTYEELAQNPGDVNVIHFSGEVAPGTGIDRLFVRVSPRGFDDAAFTVLASSGEVLAEITVRNWSASQGNWKVQFPGDPEPIDWALLSLLGTTAADTLTGSSYADEILGLAGDDVLAGAGGADTIDGGEGEDDISGGSGADLLRGSQGNDELHGGEGDDRLEGGEGQDLLEGDQGADILIGGLGDDTLDGGQGEDSYLWLAGDGHDTIHDIYGNGIGSSGLNRLVFGQEVTPATVRMVPVGADLRFEVLDADLQVVGSVSIKDWYAPFLSGLDWSIEFATGDVWLKSTLATPGDDVLSGGNADDHIRGGIGNDTLTGGAGADLIDGGPGNDVLTGGTGRDTYVYLPGDGNDVIHPNSATTGEKDLIDLTAFSREDVSLILTTQTFGVDVLITITATGETLEIKNAQFVIIEFDDAAVELDQTGTDIRQAGSIAVAPGWHDTDSDGFPDDMEGELAGFNSALADPADNASFPADDAIADASITTPSGNRFPTISAALAAAEAGRAGRPYVVIKVEPGIYAESLDLDITGVFLRGPGSAGRATITRGNLTRPVSIKGRKLIFDGLCWGSKEQPLGLKIGATDISDGIRFTNSLFADRLIQVSSINPLSIEIEAGDVAFVHCSFLELSEIKVSADASARAVNSLFKLNSRSTWAGSERLRSFSCLPSPLQADPTPPDLAFRSDGLLKGYPAASCPPLNLVPGSGILNGWRDLDGDLRDITPDIGCDEYIDVEGGADHLQDSWERRWFGNTAAQNAAGDPDSDGRSNLQEYNAETNPLTPPGSGGGLATVDLSSVDSYSQGNLLGAAPMPASGSSDWLLTEADGITLAGRQGFLEYKAVLQDTTVAALLVDISFAAIQGLGTGQGAVRIFLDGEFVTELQNTSGELLIPLYLLSAGEHTIRLELINSHRSYRPVIHSIALRALDAQYDSAAFRELLIESSNPVTVLPQDSFVSPAFIEGLALHRSSLRLNLAGGSGVEVNDGPDNLWYANVPLEDSASNTSITLSRENGELVSQHSISWKPVVLGEVSELTIRKGDSLRLKISGSGIPAASQVDYIGNSNLLGSGVLETPLAHEFAEAGTFLITASVGGNPVAGASLTLTVVEANFGEPLLAAKGAGIQWNLPNVPTSLELQADSSLWAYDRVASYLSMQPRSIGTHAVVARIGSGGPIVAKGKVNVINVTGTGANGGGRVIITLPDGRKIVNMTYTVNGPIPPNLLVRVQLYAGGTTFLDGSTVAWLSAEDFDEFGVANLEVVIGSGGAICQGVGLYLGE
ncbi:chitobiase/beta-hexosaminidase C-terminal domain-containing protein [Luteolibacter sp. GHJ8]|uniref:Chitobiase/beta-hexosaminidase C-terminal domain-containing protein n=1 Tax=Luteolibacter rhizosphaerae TaxID=2989719 RepID=A0ABT3GAV2_9BACT|nr:chitobiase/beta-hexosaminidase C-terminal domain-containing protein [Luteolibacter rhizosphaerae]MCW1916968.1 chitobiase/beta-hexosaminidase C-terminal domain-containing protein [Luteolibacter rhizosphaerae]